MNPHPEKLEAAVNRALGDLSAAQGVIMMNLGHKLGLFKAMAGRGPLSSIEVARLSGCAERYVREWLSSQVAGGYLTYHPKSQTFELPLEEALVLADDKSPYFMPHALEVTADLWRSEERSLEAFRAGRGVGWREHSDGLRCGIAAFYRNAYAAQLVPLWLPSLTGVVEKLTQGARVADVGCGHGHSTILMAQAFPQSIFYGFDAHEGSIEAAREHARASGVAERVRFEVAKATDFPKGGYDLVCFFDALHDMGHPDRALRHTASTLATDGTVLLVEPFAQDKLEDNIGPVSRMYYVGSTLLCCPHAVSEEGDYVLGAQAGEGQLTRLVKNNGFSTCRRALATPFNLLLEARV
jgi:2-polyprenyl-3-methyl-5-hydroxy-6-metoxy-1,4-benzoquinol methylase